MKSVSRRTFLGSAAMAARVLAGAGSSKAPDTDVPNILLLTADQQKASATGCYGNRLVATPHIDRLASEGVRFENFFVQCPLCAPSRASFMSGQYTHRHGVRINSDPLRSDAQSLAGVLKEMDYQSAAFGHIHRNTLCQDFDLADESMMRDWTHLRRKLADQIKDQFPEDSFYMYTTVPLSPEKDFDGIVANRVIEYLENRDPGRPFFAYAAFISPHPPYFVCPPYDSMYDPESISLPPPLSEHSRMPDRHRAASRDMGLTEDTHEELRRTLAHYYGMITYLDGQIGRILAYLRQTGLDRNTIVIFTSDHGDYAGEHRMVAKTSACYDALLKVPLIIRGPELFSGGKVVRELVESVDLMPSLLEVLGLEIPSGVQGKSFTDFLKHRKSWNKEAVFAETGGYPLPHRTNAPNGMPASGRLEGFQDMIRTSEWKLSYLPDGESELYHLSQDPLELHNLYGLPDYEEIRKDLLEQLLVWKIRTT